MSMRNDDDTCSCGSGKQTTIQRDGYGIYLTRTCPSCHADQMRKYRSDIRECYESDEPIEPDDGPWG